MATFGRPRPPHALPLPVVVAWSLAMATLLALALATVVPPVASGTRDEAASPDELVVALAAVSRTTAATTSPASSSTTNNVTSLCRSTPYPRACETALTSASSRGNDDPFAASVQFAMARATTARALARNLSASPSPSPSSGMRDCAVLLAISVAQLRDALAATGSSADGDATTWLSAALTNQGTCRDSLDDNDKPTGRRGSSDAVRRQVAALARFISTALALHVRNVKKKAVPPPSSREDGTKFPSWLSGHDRRLLTTTTTNDGDDDLVVTADAVVALDGSGTHRSINEAIADVTAEEEEEEVGTEASGGGAGGGGSRKRRRRKVVHVKAGRYEESVSISYQQPNVMLVGEGKGKTVIDGDRSVAGGYTTWSSATVAAMGAGFIARGVSIVNSAGPGQGQAVALLVSGDRSVVYECEVKGHQDTLFAHSNRQFYADTDISGTVDFVFGNAAAVLQRCVIQARRPLPGQQDVVTAQGRADPNQNTGFAIHRCRIAAAPDLAGKTTTPVYLGRPWRRYARVAVIATDLDGSVAPAGWLQWSGEPAPATVYYGEYRNTGAGAATAGRVKWTGVHASMSAEDATRFTVAKFIMGGSWLDATGVKYTAGL